MTLNFLSYLLIFLTISRCDHSHPTDNGGTITAKGIKDFEIRASRIEQIVKELGDNYQKVDDQTWHYKIIYKDLGMSFSYGFGDTVHAIEFYAPFDGKTDKNIRLDASTMNDVALAYGSLSWTTSSPFEEWSCAFPGIEFAVKRDTSLPLYPLNEKLHRSKTISRITVIDNYDDFE